MAVARMNCAGWPIKGTERYPGMRHFGLVLNSRELILNRFFWSGHENSNVIRE
jgi:hypothetical protein